MMSADLEVEVFDPCAAPDGDLAGCHEVMRAWWKADKPDLPELGYEDCVGRLRNPFPGFGPAVRWVARCGGEVVGLATVYFCEAESAHVGLTEIVVHPGRRERGIGTAVLRVLLPELRARGRREVEGWQLTAGGAGQRWAQGRGFRVVHTVLMQTLELAGVDPGRWDVAAPPEYGTRRWIGAAPEELIESYAVARQAIHDAPVGGLGRKEPEWTVGRVREHEAELADRGVEQRVVAAVRGVEVVGLTELEVHPNNPRWGYQRETAVLVGHRGHGLGVCLKAEMITWLLADRPDFQRIQTTTGAANVHMTKVNHQLGFTTTRTTVAVNSTIAELEAALDAR